MYQQGRVWIESISSTALLGSPLSWFPPTQTQRLPICLWSAACSHLVPLSLLGSHWLFLGTLHRHSPRRSCLFCCFMFAYWGRSQFLSSLVVLPLGLNPVTTTCSHTSFSLLESKPEWSLLLVMLLLGPNPVASAHHCALFACWGRSQSFSFIVCPFIVACHHCLFAYLVCHFWPWIPRSYIRWLLVYWLLISVRLRSKGGVGICNVQSKCTRIEHKEHDI